jgi:hypothetical protein
MEDKLQAKANKSMKVKRVIENKDIFSTKKEFKQLFNKFMKPRRRDQISISKDKSEKEKSSSQLLQS